MDQIRAVNHCNAAVLQFLAVAHSDSLTPELMGELASGLSHFPSTWLRTDPAALRQHDDLIAEYRANLRALRDRLLRLEAEAMVHRVSLVHELQQVARAVAWNRSRSETI